MRYPSGLARLVYRVAVLARGEERVYGHLAQLRELEKASPQQLREWQRGRLVRTLAHAWKGSALYRNRWPSAPPQDPDEAFAFLGQLPFLEKADLQSHADLIVSTLVGRSRVRSKTTGGSTGEAVTVLKNADAIAREMAASWFAYEWVGVRIGDRGARFWGNPTSVARKARFIAADLAMNRIRFSAFSFTDDDMESYWRRCLRFRPVYFYGYVSMLSAFGDFLRVSGQDGRRLGLKAIITTSEVLSPTERLMLEEVFGCPVQNEYGCGEVGPIAYSRHGGGPLHVMAQNVLLEVVKPSGDPAGPGENGEIVVTDLNNRAMPLIRYRIGDRAEQGQPETSGSPFPTLARVWGRAYDFVLTPEGRRFHGEYFMYLLEELRDRGLPLKQFQVRQTATNRLEFLLVSSEGVERHAAFLRQRVGKDMPSVSIAVRRVTDVPRAPSGKMRLIVSEIIS